jgi:hypothetical protein
VLVPFVGSRDKEDRTVSKMKKVICVDNSGMEQYLHIGEEYSIWNDYAPISNQYDVISKSGRTICSVRQDRFSRSVCVSKKLFWPGHIEYQMLEDSIVGGVK